MILSWKFIQKKYISVAGPKNIVIFALTYVLEALAVLYGDFGMNSYSIDSYEPMKRG
jgi:hypothetical protein